MNVIKTINDIRVALGLHVDTGTVVKKSTIPNAGNGLFAENNFKKNDFIDFYTGEIIYDKEKLQQDNDYLFFNDKENFYIDGKSGNKVKYINHNNDSNLRNCAYKYYMLPDINILYPIVVCIEDVNEGEEFFCDYGQYYKIN